ncbi:MAG: CDP-glycerol glycerophosphotransferase family protein [Clostridia bacterium]|nr:CDP-glycerol glycerophosphotransferase family protein [Clostridia bacterium]
MKNVEVSVIVAVNNAEKELEATLSSIKAQTLKNIEVIMLDAASDDGTAAVMKQFLSDKRFSFVRCESTSISQARNKGIALSAGKYIAFGDSNVIFSKDVLGRLYECAEREKAQLCIAPMTSTDQYGEHKFSSSRLLSKRKRISKFDTDIIWNPAVTNKLFLRSAVEENGSTFNFFGKAREVAFTVPFALSSEVIASCSKGNVTYVTPVISDGVAPFPIENYIEGYKYVVAETDRTFDKAERESTTDFEKKELRKLRTFYKDQVLSKEITVLLYSYYRHFWSVDDGDIKKYADIIMQLISSLSPVGRGELLKKNKDIFYDGRLISSKSEMAETPKVSIVISRDEKTAALQNERLEIHLSSLYSQTMPCFEVFADSRLRDIISDKWKKKENLHFIDCESYSECNNKALRECRTDYIMFQNGLTRLNPKFVMRSYLSLAGKDKYGFSASPIACFDGKKVTEYSYAALCYHGDAESTRVSGDSFIFALDLFFANKLFRADHLKGIHFSFSESPIIDMYKLYSHSRFKKLRNTGVYLPFREQLVIEYFLTEKKNMPAGALALYKNYKKLIFRSIKLKEKKEKLKSFFSKIIMLIINLLSSFLTVYYSGKKLENRVFFYSTLEKGRFSGNLDAVYNSCDYPKVIFRKAQPHSYSDVAKIRKYLLTSKVIVTDCEMEYLRAVRLRKDQRVIQLWHKSGAFRRFGLDRHSNINLLSEYKNHSQYSAVAVTSEYVRQFYAHAFGIELETVRAVGAASSDAMLEKGYAQVNAEIIRNKHPLLKNRRVYVYFPTYRESEGELSDLDPKIDWAKLNRELDDDEIFVVSRHPLTEKEFFKGAFYSRVKDYTRDPTSELLSVADVIITDYSSIIFDAVLLKKPTVFYCSDFGEFEPDFYLNYESELPGEIVKDSDYLLEAVRRAHADGESEISENFRRKYMGSCDGRSTARIIELIRSYIENRE